MSNLDFDISLSGKHIPRHIKRAIEHGMRDAGSELGRKGKMVAQTRIQQRGYIWKGELMESFDVSNKRVGNHTRQIKVRNYADHAAPSEYGATYGSRGPPIEALLPWVMSKFGGRDPGEFGKGGSGSDGPGGGGTLQRSSDAEIKGDWSKVNTNYIDRRDYFAGQKVSLLDADANLVDAQIYEIDTDELVIMLDDGRTIGISFDNDNEFYTLIARQNWSDLPRTNQLGIINSAFSTISFDNVSPRGFGEFDLSTADREAITAQWESLIQRTEWTDGYLRAAQRTTDIGALPDKNPAGNRNALGFVASPGVNPSAKSQYIAFRDFINTGDSRVQYNDHIDTYTHEFKHALLKTNGIHYSTSKYHKDQPAQRTTLYDWHLNEDGTSDNSLLHSDPVLFMLHSEDDYPLESVYPEGDPPGWDKTVREAGNYLDSLTESGYADPDPTEWLNPDDPKISIGDDIDVMRGDSLYPEQLWFLYDAPTSNGDGTWSYSVETVGGDSTMLGVDSDGNLLDGTLAFLNTQDDTIDTSQATVQQYLETDIDADPITAYREALNRTLFTHMVARDREKNTGDTELSDLTKLYDGYGMTNGQETAAVMHQIMNTEVSNKQSTFYIGDNIQGIAETHPYLLRTWLNLFSPSTVAAAELDAIGVSY